MSSVNGNRPARAIVERGARRRKRTKSQRAVIAADIFEGRRSYRPNRRELAAIFDVSTVMIDIARKLPPAARQCVANDEGCIGQFAYPNRPASAATNGAPALSNGASPSNQALFDLITAAGVERVLDVAAAVEAAQ
jgi:hypothetical protein